MRKKGSGVKKFIDKNRFYYTGVVNAYCIKNDFSTEKLGYV